MKGYTSWALLNGSLPSVARHDLDVAADNCSLEYPAAGFQVRHPVLAL